MVHYYRFVEIKIHGLLWKMMGFVIQYHPFPSYLLPNTLQGRINECTRRVKKHRRRAINQIFVTLKSIILYQCIT